MKFRFLLAGLACAAAAHGQSGKFNWQTQCFNNPGSPVCKEHDYAVKKAPAEAAPKGVVNNPFATTQSGGRPSMVNANVNSNVGLMDAVSSAMNWQFADPAADVIAGINVRALAGSPFARSLVEYLAAKEGLAAEDVGKLFEKLADVDQITVSVRGNQVAAFVIGQVPDSIGQNGPTDLAGTGLKAARVSRNAMLVGHPEAVDQAMQRMTVNAPPSDLTRQAQAKQATGAEFWAIGPAASFLPEAARAGAVRSSFTVWIRDALITELAFDLNGPPAAATLRTAQARLNPIYVQGNTILTRTSTNPNELSERFPVMTDGPIGQQLSTLIAAARYVPGIDPAAKKRKPVIVGLDDPPK